MRPRGASPSPGLAKTSALVHTWIQKGSIPRLTSWRSVISLSRHYHVHITFSLYIPCRANPILSCLPNPQIWSRGLCSPTSRTCGCLQVSQYMIHMFKDANIYLSQGFPSSLQLLASIFAPLLMFGMGFCAPTPT